MSSKVIIFAQITVAVMNTFLFRSTSKKKMLNLPPKKYAQSKKKTRLYVCRLMITIR